MKKLLNGLWREIRGWACFFYHGDNQCNCSYCLETGHTQPVSKIDHDLWVLTILLDDMDDASCHRFGKLPRITGEQFSSYFSRQAYVRALIDAIRKPDWSPSEPVDG